jgi:hypothetical protein
MGFLSEWYTIVAMIVILLGLIAALVIVRNKRQDDD